ncbi:hypothetical protein [Cohnella panacarvi]|nr:hypothetical protein [Cohnella panacarvi]
MRQILTTVLLLMTVALLYSNLVSGEDGTREQISYSGSRMADRIAKMSP